MNVCDICKYRPIERGNLCEDCRYRVRRRAWNSPIRNYAQEAATDTANMSVRRLFIPTPEGDPVRYLYGLNEELQQLARGKRP